MAESVGLMLLGAAAILLEVFVPAGGLLGLGGAALIIVGVARGFARVGPAAGWALLLSALTVLPVLALAALRLFPRSRAGRWLVLRDTQGAAYSVREPAAAAALLGREAVALTDLRPAGTAQIDGVRHSVVTDGEYVDRGTTVRVVRVEGNRIVVRGG